MSAPFTPAHSPGPSRDRRPAAEHDDAATASRASRAAAAAGLLRHGRPVPTVFETTTALAQEHGAVNLGQGFPGVSGPDELLEAAAEQVRSGWNQYAPGSGFPGLRQAVADQVAQSRGERPDPVEEVLVTTGATEGIAATVLALVRPGEAVVTTEPFYDAHAAAIALADGVHRTVPLEPPSFLPDLARLEAALEGARLLILNTPHNPTGAVYPRALLEQVVAACRRTGTLILADEVYEHLVFEGEHVPVAAVEGAAPITVTVSSAGKSLAVTGWKVGWAIGPAVLIDQVRAVKQFLTYSSGPAYQEAVAGFLPRAAGFLEGQRTRLRANRDRLVAGLTAAGLDPVVPAAGYFTVVDLAPWGIDDAAAALPELISQTGVAGIPVSALCATDPSTGGPGSPTAERLRSWMRFGFCAADTDVAEAVRRLADSRR